MSYTIKNGRMMTVEKAKETPVKASARREALISGDKPEKPKSKS